MSNVDRDNQEALYEGVPATMEEIDKLADEAPEADLIPMTVSAYREEALQCAHAVDACVPFPALLDDESLG